MVHVLEAVLGTFWVSTIRWSLFLALFCGGENQSLEILGFSHHMAGQRGADSSPRTLACRFLLLGTHAWCLQ